jgi:16S rRNA (guanine527-N7)-methyltransferase
LTVTPGFKSLDAILRRCDIALDRDELNALWMYHQMLRAANAELNLTRIHNFQNVVLKHYVDSLLVLRFVDLPSPLLDLGSGAGLPGIPLKIVRPDIRMILAEPRAARAAFLREVCDQLRLRGVEIYEHKVGRDYPGLVSGVISRAVGSMPATLERVASCLSPRGLMIFMKGPACDPELEEAQRTRGSQFRLQSDHPYEIPGTPHRRRLVVFERLEGAAQEPEQAGLTSTVPGVALGAPAREITSAANPTFQRCRDLLSGAGIRKHGEAIVGGSRIRAEVLERFAGHVLGWLTDPHGPPPPAESIPWLRFSAPLFRELDVAGTHAPLLLARVPPIPAWSDEDPWPDGCTLFVPFQDPENVGAVIRSAAAFGVARVVLLRQAAHPFHPRSCRAAGCALFQMPLLQGPTLEELQVKHAPLVALDTTGPELSESPFPDCFGLVAGIEGPGLPAHLREGARRRIAMQTGVESLNAAAATAIALYVWSRRRRSKITSSPEPAR